MDTRYNKEYHSGTLLTSTKFSNELNLTYYRNIFYTHNLKSNILIKDIPLNFEILLNPITIAIWLMDDGHFTHGAIYINTHSFSIEGLDRVIAAFKKRYELRVKIRKVSGKDNQFRLVLSASETKKLIPIILPYFTPSMLYKLGF